MLYYNVLVNPLWKHISQSIEALQNFEYCNTHIQQMFVWFIPTAVLWRLKIHGLIFCNPLTATCFAVFCCFCALDINALIVVPIIIQYSIKLKKSLCNDDSSLFIIVMNYSTDTLKCPLFSFNLLMCMSKRM